MTNKISIITPSYNQSSFIERTIQSVLMQAIPHLEYVIIDGKSTDDTVKILKKYQAYLQWSSEPDKGQAHAVNKGIKQTSGDIIGWLNSDDIYYPGTLTRILSYFESNPAIEVVYGNAYHIDANDNILEEYYTERWNPHKLKELCYLCQPAVFFRRSVIERFGMLNETLHYCMDYELWLRFATKGVKFAYISDFLSGSRLHADTKTLGSRVKVHAEINDMLKGIYKRVPDRWLSNYAHAFIETTYPPNYPKHLLKRRIAIKTLISSIAWNKSISLHLLITTMRWFISHFILKKHT